MKFRLYVLMLVLFGCTLQSSAQYKDLEGVFFGKVVALGMGGSVHLYQDKLISTGASITPLSYSVLLNQKTIFSSSITFHKKSKIVYNGNDGFANYTKTIEPKTFEYQLALKFALTSEGLDKPTSLFMSLSYGGLLGKGKVTDTRWSEDDINSQLYLGAGLAVFHRLGSRFVVFAEPSYRQDMTPKTSKIYLDDNGQRKLSFSNITGQVGFMFLIGKSN